MLASFTPTKEKLLTVLNKANESSMKDIMEHFELSEIAIRRHLQDLIRNDLVKERSVKQEIGRPYKVYSLTIKGRGVFPNEYKELPLELLKDLEEMQGVDVVNKLLKKRHEREEAELLSRMKTASFHDNVKSLIDYQTEKGYMIESEEIEDGYKLTNYNCPIDNIASSYIQLCVNERNLLETAFPKSRIKSHSRIADGDCSCKWTILKPKTN